MADAGQGPERGCDPDLVPSDCGNRNQSLVYFLTYMFIGTFVLLNLVVAVILENFSALGNVNPDLVSAADITDFGELWSQSWTERAANMESPPTPRRASRRDARSMMAMEESQLAKLVLLQPPPLGVAGQTDEAGAQSFILGLRLPKDANGFVQFQDVINALVRASFEGGHPEGFEAPALPEGEFDAFDDSAPPASKEIEYRKPQSPPPEPPPKPPPKRPPKPAAQPARPAPPPAPLPNFAVAVKPPMVSRPEAVPPLPMAMNYAEQEAEAEHMEAQNRARLEAREARRSAAANARVRAAIEGRPRHSSSLTQWLQWAVLRRSDKDLRSRPASADEDSASAHWACLPAAVRGSHSTAQAPGPSSSARAACSSA